MKINKLTKLFAVADQLEVTDIAVIKKLGYELIINNRPDGEIANQPCSYELEQESIRCGIRYIYLPITILELGDRHIGAFFDELSTTNGLVLGFCRSGMRAIKLWALNESRNHSIDNIVKTAKHAGYDISQFREQISAQSALKEIK